MGRFDVGVWHGRKAVRVQHRDRLGDLVLKASASRAANEGSNPAFSMGLFPCRVMPVT